MRLLGESVTLAQRTRAVLHIASIAFDKLASDITPNNNWLVFYAGVAGFGDSEKNFGYWLPADCQ